MGGEAVEVLLLQEETSSSNDLGHWNGKEKKRIKRKSEKIRWDTNGQIKRTCYRQKHEIKQTDGQADRQIRSHRRTRVKVCELKTTEYNLGRSYSRKKIARNIFGSMLHGAEREREREREREKKEIEARTEFNFQK